MTENTAAVIETPAPSEDDAMAAVWDKLASEEVEQPEPAKEEPTDGLQQEEKAEEVTEDAPEAETAEETEAEEQEPEDQPEAPTDLPASLRAKWANMPEDAREAVLASHRDLNRRMADQGRVVQVAKPVYDVLVRAASEIPTLKDMTPAQIAGDVFKMAQIQGQLAQDPVNTILGIAKQYGAMDAIKQAVSGQSQTDAARENVALVKEIRDLRSQLERNANPEAFEQRINQTLTVRETERMVSDYATQKEYWSDVEPVIPQMIPIAQQRLGEGASPKDVLDAAYDMAIHAIPDLRAKVKTAVSTPATPDPARTAAQLKAKSVNVKSTSSGKPKPQSEEERLSAIWDKYH